MMHTLPPLPDPSLTALFDELQQMLQHEALPPSQMDVVVARAMEYLCHSIVQHHDGMLSAPVQEKISHLAQRALSAPLQSCSLPELEARVQQAKESYLQQSRAKVIPIEPRKERKEENLKWTALDVPYGCLGEILRDYPNLTELDLSDTWVHLDDIRQIEACTQLQVLSLARCRMLQLHQEDSLPAFPALRKLNLSGNQIESLSLMSLLQTYTKLTELDLSYTNVQPKGIQELRALRNLSRIDIAGCPNLFLPSSSATYLFWEEVITLHRRGEDVEDDIVGETIKLWSNLSRVILTHSSSMTNKTLQEVAALKNLTKLDVSHCEQVDAEGIAFLNSLHHCRALNLEGCKKIDRKAIEALKRTRFVAGETLQELNLSRCSGLTDFDLQMLAVCVSLRVLVLSHLPEVTDEALVKLASLPRLEELDLSFSGDFDGLSKERVEQIHLRLKLRERKTMLSEKGMESLAQSKSLKKLFLQNNFELTDGMVSCLRHSISLTYLNLDECKLKESMQELFKIPSLTEIHLSHISSLRDAALVTLPRAKSLRSLTLNACRSLTPACIDILSSAMSLESLHLENMSQAIKNFHALSALTQLKELNLSGNNQLKDEQLSFLSSMPHLVSLPLSGMRQLTEKTLEIVASLTHLRHIVVSDFGEASKISADAYARLQKKNPFLFIEMKETAF